MYKTYKNLNDQNNLNVTGFSNLTVSIKIQL